MKGWVDLDGDGRPDDINGDGIIDDNDKITGNSVFQMRDDYPGNLWIR